MDDTPRWLDDDEVETWKRLSQLVVRLPAALDAQLQRDAGLSWFEYMVLAVVSEQPGRTLRMSSLAVLANGSLSRLSHVVKRLEGRGLVRRRPDPADGRFTDAVLTDHGWTTLAAAAPAHAGLVRDLVFDTLTGAQVRQLHAVTGRVVAALDAAEGDCAGP